MKEMQSRLVDLYLNWLKNKINLKNIENNIIEINTPFLDRHNDHLQIYAIMNGEDIKLTDDGYILNDLGMCGCEVLTSPKRRQLLNTTLNSYGVQFSPITNEIYTETTIDKYPQKKHMLIQAMLATNDIFMTSREHIFSIFLEEVSNYFLANEIRFTQNISFIGKSGFTHKFDFVIPLSKRAPERIIHTLNNPTRQGSEALLFSWNDTKDTRPAGSKLYAFLNDTDKSVSNDILNAFKEYKVIPALWSKKNNYLDELVA